jgi:Cu+-exporting ATPase
MATIDILSLVFGIAVIAGIWQYFFPRRRKVKSPQNDKSGKIGDSLPQTVTYHVGGISCPSCLNNITSSLQKLEGVGEVFTNFVTEEVTIQYNAHRSSPEQFQRAIHDLGYRAETTHDDAVTKDSQSEHVRDLRTRLFAAIILTLPVLLGAMRDMVGLRAWAPAWTMNPYVQWALITPVQFYSGWHFIKGMWGAVRNRTADMNTLVGIGTLAAYVYSVAATLFHQWMAEHGIPPEAYFETCGVVITLVLTGRLLEARAKSRTSQAIKKLLAQQPAAARVVLGDREVELPVEQVKVGDRIRVRPGEKVPADGVIIEGESSVDESAITGESMPVMRGNNDEVTGGTLNGTGSFIMEAQRVGAGTVIAQIVRLVQDAQKSRAPIQRLADTVSGYFVPAVLMVGIATFTVWVVWGPAPALVHGLTNFVAVMLIACPCALGLATPTSIMVGSGKGAEHGILFRNAEALEMAHKLTTIVLDKTGTITKGEPELTDVIVAAGWERKDVLRFAAGAELGSEHPLSQAIVAAAMEELSDLPKARNFQAIAGHGISAIIDGHNIVVGTEKLMRDHSVATEELLPDYTRLTGEGKTSIFISSDGRLSGIVAVADTIKPSSASAIKKLQERGLEVIMITGDNPRTAEAVARSMGIDHVYAGILPQDKEATIRRLQGEGKIVGMVGDGINDAPALARADVGIAIGSGTDVAIESAGVILLSGDLLGVVNTIELSTATIRNIKQNLFFAFIYNLLGIPIAAGALYPMFGILLSPIIAAAAMSTSSISVVTNALRLRGYRVSSPTSPTNEARKHIMNKKNITIPPQETHRDPICGMSVDPSTAAGRSEYEGTTYYFCAPGCKKKFDENPAKYAHSEHGNTHEFG